MTTGRTALVTFKSFSANVVSTEALFTPIPSAALYEVVASFFTITLNQTSDNVEYSFPDDLQPTDFVFTCD